MDEEARAKLIQSAHQIIGDIVYTVVFDTSNEMISAGLDQATVLECANSVAHKYTNESIKMRKKPSPRAKPRASVNQMDAVTAASRKMKKKVSERFTWVYHPSSNDYSYSTDTRLVKGYPLKHNVTNKIVGVVDDSSCHSLSIEDARVAVSMGLDVDFRNVVKDEKS